MNATTPAHILIVEDDLHLGFLLMEVLEDAGYQVRLSKNSPHALKNLAQYSFDLCLLDIMMPGEDGFSLGQRIRQDYPDLPFLYLTAKSRKEDQLKAYACGAEDFLVKPFDEDLLRCKIEVILRRKGQISAEEADFFQIGKYEFNYPMQALSYEDNCARLTEKESEILRLLCLHQNQILRKEVAVEKVYGRKDYFLGRSFDVFISRLRKHLSEDPRIVIENVFKVGFILKVPH
ncbi:MAG: response regulator transcription factor [Bacteroidota bacterium]